MNDTHVQEENINYVTKMLEGVEALGQSASSRAGDITDTQGGGKWSQVQGASASSDAMQRVSTELSRVMQSAAKTTRSFYELIQATHREFLAQDEQGKEMMSKQLQQLCDVFQGYNNGAKTQEELMSMMELMMSTLARAAAGQLTSTDGTDTED